MCLTRRTVKINKISSQHHCITATVHQQESSSRYHMFIDCMIRVLEDSRLYVTLIAIVIIIIIINTHSPPVDNKRTTSLITATVYQ